MDHTTTPASKVSQICKDDRLRNYVLELCNGYEKLMGSYKGPLGFVYMHIKAKKLCCNCLICVPIKNLFGDYSKMCLANVCSVNDCPHLKSVIEDHRRKIVIISAHLMQVAKDTHEAVQKAQDVNKSQISTSSAQRTTAIVRSDIQNKKFAIQRCIRTLEHASHCMDPNCMPIGCQKMKRVLSHIKTCKRKLSASCVVCKQICFICCFHAKTCKEEKCSVLLCEHIKSKIAKSMNINRSLKLLQFKK